MSPTITSHPVNKTAVIGSDVTFSATATGTAPFTYQWKRNGENIGTNSDTPTATDVQPGTGATNEDCNISMDPSFDAAGPFPLTAGSKDAATRVTSSQGGLTIHAAGKGQTGIAIIEIYESP